MSDQKTGAKEILTALDGFKDPESGKSVTQSDQVKVTSVESDSVSLKLKLTTYCAPLWNEIKNEIRQIITQKFPPIKKVDIEIEIDQRPVEKIGQIGLSAKSVIAVGSGKGGVGKSTIATSLAVGLQRAGCRVGLMDADVYGPSVPHLLGASGRPAVDEVTQKIQPIEIGGLKIMSIGLLVPPGEAIVWRGPMLHGAITQFLRDTAWGELDFLIIDMPPGTGDIALTLSQLLPLTGAVVVCTPQDVALLDAVKAIAMFGKVKIPVLGMVENMSYFVCPDCDKRHNIFGHGGARSRAEELNIPFLGEVPIDTRIRVRGDAGQMSSSFDDEGVADHYEAICSTLLRGIIEKRRAEPPLPTLSVL